MQDAQTLNWHLLVVELAYFANFVQNKEDIMAYWT